MPLTPVKDVRGLGTGRLKTSSAAGPADRFSSQSLINAEGVIQQLENNGVAKFKVRGDGRRNGGILTATPSVLTPGDYYIKTVAGIDYWVFVDTAGVEQLIAPTSPVTYPLTIVGANYIETFPVDTVGVVRRSIALVKVTTGQRHSYEVAMGHDGTTSADATVANLTLTAGIAIGALDVTFNADLLGTGGSQVMRWFATPASLGWSVVYSPDALVAP